MENKVVTMFLYIYIFFLFNCSSGIGVRNVFQEGVGRKLYVRTQFFFLQNNNNKQNIKRVFWGYCFFGGAWVKMWVLVKLAISWCLNENIKVNHRFWSIYNGKINDERNQMLQYKYLTFVISIKIKNENLIIFSHQ